MRLYIDIISMVYTSTYQPHGFSSYCWQFQEKEKLHVLSIEGKLKICDLAESGRCWSTITHTNEHYGSFLSPSARKRLQTFEQTKISD